MSLSQSCLPPGKLRELIDGRVEEPHLSLLTDHLEQCVQCQLQAKPLFSSDTLVETLRSTEASSDAINALVPHHLIAALKRLLCENTLVSDLSPIAGAKLEEFMAGGGSRITDFSVLREMPLTSAKFDTVPERDLAMLREIKTLVRINDQRAADILIAGNGREILIGGLGLDILNGGTGDDILIAGRTTSDTSLTSLTALRTAWLSAVPYGTRVANLQAGVGSPVVSLKAKINVLNDGGEDDVILGAGDTDWFFRALDDVITDLVAGELIDVL